RCKRADMECEPARAPRALDVEILHAWPFPPADVEHCQGRQSALIARMLVPADFRSDDGRRISVPAPATPLSREPQRGPQRSVALRPRLAAGLPLLLKLEREGTSRNVSARRRARMA